MTDRATAAEAAGLYVHIPFCLTRCGYCDLNTYAGLGHLSGRYVDALQAEADHRAPPWSGVSFASLFLGGGTPTTLPAASIQSLLEHFRSVFDLLPGAEITTEANPDTVGEDYLSALRDVGVTRLSFGVQSFDVQVLRALERIHSPDSARAAFHAARRAGFDDVNVDLIYGANGESSESWQRTVTEAVDLGPEHVSCYALTIEPATSLGRKVAASLVAPPDPDLQAEMYEVACATLAEAGYEHYEISNWARPGHRSVHNLGYWQGRSYLGLGAGAHSFRQAVRWWNVRPPQRYLGLVEEGRLPTGGSEELSEDERRMERLLLGLRVADGVPDGWIDADRARPFVTGGLAERRSGRFSLTDRGMLLANEVVLALEG
jgi:putative oxygen-independent coproporphyrinogen III oxidase